MQTPEDSSSPKDQPPTDVWLEQALRGDTTTYLADDGFTANVLRALPPRRTPPWRRPALIGGAAAIGTLLAASLGGADLFRETGEAITWLIQWSAQPLLDTGLTLGTVGTLVLCAIIVWTFWRSAVQE